MNLRKEELIEWCWEHLQFDNCPEAWEDTYIVDILNGYNNDCHTTDGKSISYSSIRFMFQKNEEEDQR